MDPTGMYPTRSTVSFAPYSDSCGHVLNQMNESRLRLANDSADLGVVSIDLDEYPELFDEPHIRGVPSVKLFRYVLYRAHSFTLTRDGQRIPTDYTGSLDSAAMVSWVQKQIKGGVQYLTSLADLEQFSQTNPSAVIGYFPSAGPDILETFRSLNKIVLDIPFAYSSDPEIGTRLGSSVDSVIVTTATHQSSMTINLTNSTALHRFISMRKLPTRINVTAASVTQIWECNFPTLFLIKNGSFDETAIHAIERHVRDKQFVLAIGDCTDNTTRKLMGLLGERECATGSAWILEDPLNPASRKFRTADVSTESILSFLDTFESTTPVIKSEPEEPLDAESGEANVIVGSNFQDVLARKGPSLILFYTRWCSRCADVVDVFDEVALKVHADMSLTVLVGRMDKAGNDSPGIAIYDYPTVVLFMSPTHYVRYTGELSVDPLITWLTGQMNSRPIVKHTHHPVNATRIRDEL